MKVVVGIVKKAQKILIIKRQKTEKNLQWQFPGGKIEINETPKDAIIREIFEETNIICKPIKKIEERTHPDTNVQTQYRICSYLSGTIAIKNKEEINEVCWCKKEELGDLFTSDIAPAVMKHLRLDSCDKKDTN